MSAPARNNRSQFITMLLWMAMIFLGYQMFFGSKNNAAPLSLADAKKELQAANLYADDAKATNAFGQVEKAIGTEKIAQADKDKLWLEAQIVLADTLVQSANKKKDVGLANRAADTFIDLERRFGITPLWNHAATLGDPSKGATREVSLAQMKDTVRETASRLGRTTPVWGFFPGYEMIEALVGMTGKAPGFSFAFACLILAIAVRVIIFPLSHKQMMWGRQMSQLSPLVNEIKQKYSTKDGKPMTMEQQTLMNQKVMELYKEYGVNPMSGCAPAMLQLPLFLMVYQSMLHYRFEFEKGTFLWINAGIGKATNGFLAANLGQKDYLLIFIYGVTMVTTTLLTPVSDPANAKQQRLMGIGVSVLFGIMMFFWPVPSAFVLYWVFLNILATSQSLWTYRLPLPPLVKKNTVVGGVIPTAGTGDKNGKPVGQQKTGVPLRHKPKKKK